MFPRVILYNIIILIYYIIIIYIIEVYYVVSHSAAAVGLFAIEI